MDFSAKLKYITTYIILNSLGIYLAYKNWWISESSNPIPGFVLFFYAGICWIGIVFLGIMISQIISFRQEKKYFISPFSLATKGDYKERFGDDAKRMKISVQIISFGILFLTFFVFVTIMHLVKNYQLKEYGVTEYAKIKSISKDAKGNEFSSIRYNKSKNSSTLLTKYFTDPKEYDIGDSIKIIYSSKNPDIVELFKEYKN